MRAEFFRLLKEEMAKDDSIFLLVADMGLGIIETFQQNFPYRFLNVGISEQNMVGVAAGLCNVGFRPFCYTLSNFISGKCFEQIRNDVCLHRYPVTLVGNSTGFDLSLLGATHQVIDDIGCLKVLPELNIYSPSTVSSIRKVFIEIMLDRKPAYIRIGKSSCDVTPLGKGLNHMVRANHTSDVLVVTHGTMLENCLNADKLNGGFSIYCMNKVKPLDDRQVKSLFEKYSKVVVVEDHIKTSGLYGSLCRFSVEMGIVGTRLYSIGTPEMYEDIVGDKDFFADRYGYSPSKIAHFIAELNK